MRKPDVGAGLPDRSFGLFARCGRATRPLRTKSLPPWTGRGSSRLVSSPSCTAFDAFRPSHYPQVSPNCPRSGAGRRLGPLRARARPLRGPTPRRHELPALPLQTSPVRGGHRRARRAGAHCCACRLWPQRSSLCVSTAGVFFGGGAGRLRGRTLCADGQLPLRLFPQSCTPNADSRSITRSRFAPGN